MSQEIDQASNGDAASPPQRDYNLDVTVEMTRSQGLLMSINDEQTACAVISQCVLGSIAGQPPLAQERIIHMLDRKTFTITFQITKIK